ncbi:PQQ-binding-like beta-propeller repeat protein [Sphingomonas daechungensis]|uniref:outer membrane protein assembly factor BamB family protein n=1 Tax=Sphingomonas daechungensis TaxID=1176646 RepID=UPI003783135E
MTIRQRVGVCLAAAALAIGLSACGKQSEADNQAGELVQSTDEFQSRAGKPIDIENHPGKDLFENNCAMCHNGTVPKAPNQVWLEMMAPDAILAAMNGGLMSKQAASLSSQERVQIAEYLSRISLADYRPPAPPKQCNSPQLAGGPPPAAVGWGLDNRRFVPASVAGLSAQDVPKLKVKWAFAYPGAIRARSQPSIGWGTVFVGGHDGTLYAFDLASGCLRWSKRISAEVRTAIVADAATKRLYFGDILGRAYAVNAMNGAEIWQRKVDNHPNATITGTPSLAAGMLFVPVSSLEVTSAADPAYACCTFRGNVVALDPATGVERWRTFTVPQPARKVGKHSSGTDILGPSGALQGNSPDSTTLLPSTGSGETTRIAGGREQRRGHRRRREDRKALVDRSADDRRRVERRLHDEECQLSQGEWAGPRCRSLSVADPPGRQGHCRGGPKSGVVHGIDPTTGKILWRTRLGHGGTQGGVHFGMSAEGNRVLVPINDMADTRDGRKYDASIRGAGIHAVDATNGKILWRAFAPNNCGSKQFCDPDQLGRDFHPEYRFRGSPRRSVPGL